MLIPVTVDNHAWVPPLLRPLARRGIDEIDAIADAVLGRRPAPPPLGSSDWGRTERVLICLQAGEAEGDVRVQVRIGPQQYGDAGSRSLTPSLGSALADYLRGFRTGLRRSPDEAERASLESAVADLGRQLRALCLPGDAGDAVANLLDGCPVGTLVEIVIQAEGAELLGLPFETLRLPDDRLVVTHPSAVMLRRPLGLERGDAAPLAGPLKILAAVGAPDEQQTAAAVLDLERELQNILDALQQLRDQENCQVRILEVGHPEQIAAAIESDAYHILHLSCHGSPGVLILEDEDGRPVPTAPGDLLEPIKRTGRPLPLVLLSACHGGVQDGQTASFAESLLRQGVPAVLAMQTSVSDHYATLLADARKELERDRLAAVQRGAPLHQTQPEYATAALYVSGDERPLADFSQEKQPLRKRPVYEMAGPVPQLRIDDLIGRRRELRETLRTLRDPARRFAGVVLTGAGGVGKSALAGRAMQRLQEDGWAIAAHGGRFDLGNIATQTGIALEATVRDAARQIAAGLLRPDQDDRVRFALLARALAELPLLLVLDDFEQNLAPGGGQFLDADLGGLLQMLGDAARRGRLLITSRYPVAELAGYLHRVPVGPLSPAESRKLVLRLDTLKPLEPAALARILRVIGGHPRMLELLDALARGGVGRLTHVTQKLDQLLRGLNIDPAAAIDRLDEALQTALLLGSRDIFLADLLERVRGEGLDAALLQTAVSSLPVAPAGLARMLAGEHAMQAGDAAAAERALRRLEDLSLVHRFPDRSGWVHRWTAEGLARLDPDQHAARCVRAGRYRMWRAANETHSLEDGIEAVRNFLSGGDFDAAAETAIGCLEALARFQQSLNVAALASEVLETLPESHPYFSVIAHRETEAHLSLGWTDRALRRYGELLERHERLAQAEPDRADYQRDLVVSHWRLGLIEDAGGESHLRQALAILVSLKQAGRLNPVDEPYIDQLRKLLRERGFQPS